MLRIKTKTEVAIELLISLQTFAGGSWEYREFWELKVKYVFPYISFFQMQITDRFWNQFDSF